MSTTEAKSEPGKLRWQDLPAGTRQALAGKLEGLYGAPSDEAAFDSLAIDKQQALLILTRRFIELNLWPAVQRIGNVYGEGGVGMNFEPSPLLHALISTRLDFTNRFANHKDTTEGFIERGVGRASLHVLYVDQGKERQWAAHFDLYNPWASPMNAFRHLWHEKIKGYRPDWQAIGCSIWGESELPLCSIEAKTDEA
jgi:hypothetical protein